MNHEGKYLKKWLFDNKLKATELSTRLGISKQAVYNQFENEVVSDTFKWKLEDANILVFNTDKSYSKSKSTASEFKEGVPVYDVDVTAGNSLDFSNHPPEMIKGYISLPNFKNCIAFIMVRGDSMYPKFKAGDLIGLEPVIDMSIIQWGHAYVVVTQDNQRMLKYLRKGTDKETIILKSESELYDDIDLPMKKVLKLYMAKGPVRDDWQ